MVKRWLQSRERVSVLPVYTIDGYITFTTFMGTCTGDMFVDFIINDLLLLYNVYPASKSVVVLNNALIYYSNIDEI